MKLFYTIVGVLLILAGLPLFWTPVPIGAVLILIGIALIVGNSSSARNWLRESRSRHARLNRWMSHTEKYLPTPFSRALRDTHPSEQ